MKRWLVRLGALSTVVLSGLLYYAYGLKGPAKASAVAEAEETVPAVKPIPLVADEPAEPPAHRSANPFAARSKLIDSAENTATDARYASHVEAAQPIAAAEPAPAGDRYATVGYQERPSDEASAPTEAPRQLPLDAQATEISTPHAQGDRYANTTAASEPAEPADASTDNASPGRYEQAMPNATLTGEAESSPNEAAAPGLVPVGQFSRASTAAAGAATAATSQAVPTAVESPFARNAGTATDLPTDRSAFERPTTEAAQPATISGLGKPGNRNLDGAQSPSLTIEKTAPPEITVGKPATFLIHVRNVGQVAAHEVEVYEEVPQGTQLVATKPTATEDQGKLLWQLGTLKPGDETTLEMQVTPTSEGELGSVASVTFRADASVRTRATRPQLKLDVTAPARVLIGETAQLKIRLSNPGSGAATGVVLSEEIPAGLKHEGGRELEFEVGTLAPGESRELTLALTAVQPGVAANVLRAVGEGNLQAEDRDEIEVVAPALKVAVEGPGRRFLQRNATYTIAVHNPGTAPAKNIELSAGLPRGLRFVEANNQGQYDATAHRVAWSLEELPPGETGKVSLTMLAVEPGELRLQVQGKADMGLQDSVEEEVSVEGVAAILFELVDVQDPIELGGEAHYEIRVINQGSAPATNVQLAVLFPPEMKPIGADGPVRHTLEPQRILFEPLGQLAPKADTLYTIKARGESPGDLRVRVQLVTDEIKQPVTKEESTRVYADE